METDLGTDARLNAAMGVGCAHIDLFTVVITLIKAFLGYQLYSFLHDLDFLIQLKFASGLDSASRSSDCANRLFLVVRELPVEGVAHVTRFTC